MASNTDEGRFMKGNARLFKHSVMGLSQATPVSEGDKMITVMEDMLSAPAH